MDTVNAPAKFEVRSLSVPELDNSDWIFGRPPSERGA